MHEDINSMAIILQLFPDSIQDSLLSDTNFLQKYNILPDAQIKFHQYDVTFHRSILFNAVRDVLSNNKKDVALTDNIKQKWLLRLDQRASEMNLFLSKDSIEIVLPVFFLVLASDPNTRLEALNRMITDVYLPESDYNKWSILLSERSLKDYEVNLLQSDIDNSPVEIERQITLQLQQGSSTIETLVPQSKAYYERLVGVYTPTSTIIEYMSNHAKIHFDHLISWKPYDGFLFSLLLAAHSSITSTNITKQLDTETLIKAYKWLQDYGDIISQIGAIEIGLSILNEKPELEPYIHSMIEQLLKDNPDDSQSRFNLLSSLVTLVDGQLSHIKVLEGIPSYWRRLASIAHASLLERCLIEQNIDFEHFGKWASEVRLQDFHLQTFCDLRLEPRWNSDYISAHQLKFEFIGRLIGTVANYQSNILSPSLQSLLLEDHPGSLQNNIQFPYPFLPGPLEGSLDLQPDVPIEIRKHIEEQLLSSNIQFSSFISLVNYALIYKLDTYHAKLAAEALRTMKYQLRKVANHQELFYVLSGLATVASITRSQELAAELKVITQKYRLSSGEYKLTADEFLWIGLITASAHQELSEWCKFVGEWLTSLAFQSLQNEESKRLHSHLLTLCHIVPELWPSCGKAEAALKSLAAS